MDISITKREQSLITLEKLKEILFYDPNTGHWFWLDDRHHKIVIGTKAGHLHSRGYIVIKINDKAYKAHRLAWFYMTGVWPDPEVDHENTIKHDNRWCNLREATKTQNKENTSKYKNNKCGLKGVSYHKSTGKYRASISIDKRSKHLGLRDTPEEAFELYKEAAIKYHGEFARF
jgi:hypothetical protein